MGTLKTEPALDRPDLLAPPVLEALRRWSRASDVLVAPIDPALAPLRTHPAFRDLLTRLAARAA